ncbi:YbhN family protein [Paraconexibacter sp.]|uniref:lysylphosphatidylglycerol synthase transmembrane domain-containing protein n=1 Tax=Paraconexibacter sp. TaxID=2949640 RepID=UPI00356A235A
MRLAAISDDISTFFDAVGEFFGSLAEVQPGPLAIGLLCFGIYLSLRARAFFHVLRAAYPTERIEYRRIWGAYVAAYGFNNVVPARGGDVIKLFLSRTSVPRSSYPAVGAAFFVEGVFDATMGVFILTFAFTQGVFPKPPDFSKLGAFDLSFFASHPRFTLFFLTALGVLSLVLFAVLSRRVQAFWERVQQGLTILYDRPRYFREVWMVQFVGWLFRFTAFFFLLEAFNIGGSVKNVLLVLGVNAVAAIVPFTPGGAGVQQAFLVKVFGAGAVAYSVGQQIAIATFSLALGFIALVTIFRFRSFKEVIAAGREARAAEAAAEGFPVEPDFDKDARTRRLDEPREDRRRRRAERRASGRR